MEDGKIVQVSEPADIVNELMDKVPLKYVSTTGYGNNLVEIRDLKKYYYPSGKGLLKAVDGVNITIKDYGVHGLIGFSGSGKSVIVKIISGDPEITGYEGGLSGKGRW